MQVADTLRLARWFEIRIRMSKSEATYAIRGMRNLSYQMRVGDLYTIDTQIPNQPNTFIVEHLQSLTTQVLIKGTLREEENMYLTVITGKVYPSQYHLVGFLIITFAWLAFGLALLYYALPIGIFVLLTYLYIPIRLFLHLNQFLKTFTKHLQVTEAERTIHEC
jgi:hypothetical protein